MNLLDEAQKWATQCEGCNEKNDCPMAKILEDLEYEVKRSRLFCERQADKKKTQRLMTQ
jgi:hypothetical protein